MADYRDRSRMVFETSELMKRAIRIRAGVDGLKPAAVVNAALQNYLGREIALVTETMKQNEADAGSEAPKSARNRRQHS
jgi:hypothetical protein